MTAILGRLPKDILLRKTKAIGCTVDGGKHAHAKLLWAIFVVGALSRVRIIWWFTGSIGRALGLQGELKRTLTATRGEGILGMLVNGVAR